jgi:tellurite resistance protein
VAATAEKSSLQHLPVTLFTTVMGLGGLTTATESVERHFGVPGYVSIALLAVTSAVWLTLVVAYLTKLIRYPQAVRDELNNPIRLSFFPAISVGLLLITAALLPYLPGVTHVLWWIAVAAQLGFTLMILNRWIHTERFTVEHNSPAWFIPILANLLVPISGAPLGYVEVSYFFFAIGIVFWLPLLAISLNRSFFFAPIPQKLMPSLFILIVPPALASIAWTALHDGKLDDFGTVLYFFGLFMTLMVISQWRKFVGLPFALTWWAFSFPIASITLATLLHFTLVGQVFFLWLGLSLYVVLVLVVVTLVVRTAALAFRGRLLLPES